MSDSQVNFTFLERTLSLFSKIRPGEGRSVLLLSINGLILLTAYYILKTLREPLILTEFSPEIRSYAIAAIAVSAEILVSAINYNLCVDYRLQ